MVEVSQKNNPSSDWNVYNDWSSPILPDWKIFDNLFSTYEKLLQDQYAELNSLLKKWDHLLRNFGKDPTRTNWNHFRPLRLNREEDWSDWLAHLLEQSQTGTFAHHLFANHALTPDNFANPVKVEREVAYLAYRADLIIHWSNNHYAHIEIKIGDPNLQKTFATSKIMRNRYHQSAHHWSNYILLLSNQTSDWYELNNNEPDEPPITVLTWDEVAIALRRGLQSNENHSWKVWARAFIGSIEQKLIGYPGHRLTNHPIKNLKEKINILQHGLTNE